MQNAEKCEPTAASLSAPLPSALCPLNNRSPRAALVLRQFGDFELRKVNYVPACDP